MTVYRRREAAALSRVLAASLASAGCSALPSLVGGVKPAATPVASADVRPFTPSTNMLFLIDGEPQKVKVFADLPPTLQIPDRVVLYQRGKDGVDISLGRMQADRNDTSAYAGSFTIRPGSPDLVELRVGVMYSGAKVEIPSGYTSIPVASQRIVRSGVDVNEAVDGIFESVKGLVGALEGLRGSPEGKNSTEVVEDLGVFEKYRQHIGKSRKESANLIVNTLALAHGGQNPETGERETAGLYLGPYFRIRAGEDLSWGRKFLEMVPIFGNIAKENRLADENLRAIEECNLYRLHPDMVQCLKETFGFANDSELCDPANQAERYSAAWAFGGPCLRKPGGRGSAFDAAAKLTSEAIISQYAGSLVGDAVGGVVGDAVLKHTGSVATSIAAGMAGGELTGNLTTAAVTRVAACCGDSKAPRLFVDVVPESGEIALPPGKWDTSLKVEGARGGSQIPSVIVSKGEKTHVTVVPGDVASIPQPKLTLQPQGAFWLDRPPPSGEPGPDFRTSYQMEYSFAPSRPDWRVKWTSSNNSLAAVDDSGMVRSISGSGTGTVTITATAVQDPRVTASVTVDIKDRSGLIVEID